MDYRDVYGRLHARNPNWFSGYSIKACVGDITELIRDHGVTRLLDYGSGKGYQYLQRRVHEQWGGLLPHCYDIGVKQLSKRPKSKFDGIICTDVMEHIEEADVPMILADIFDLVDRGPAFVYFYIACRPARQKRLPDGRNVHLTIKPPAWWDKELARFTRHKLTIRAAYDEG